MNTELLHRLAWKEFRTVRAFWLSLLAMAFVFELGLAWLTNDPRERSKWVFTVALFLPVVYSLACAAMAFAGECEEGTDQLLSRLAAPPMALLSTKLALNVVSTIALLLILYPLAWMLAQGQGHWGPWREYGSLSSIHVLALAWGVGLFSWGLFFSLLFRRVLPCLIAATVATAVTPLVVSVILELLTSKQVKYEAFEWTMRLAIIPGLLLLASSRLVQTWDDERWPRFVERILEAWRRVTAKSERLTDASRAEGQFTGGWRVLVRPVGLCWPDEWLPGWRREARRLLWLEWRSAWRVMAFLLAAFGVYVVCTRVFVAAGSMLLAKEFPFVMVLVAFVFGAWSFHIQQSGQRFRDFAGHGASPARMWCIKQGVWISAMLFTVVILTATAWLSSGRGFAWWHTVEELWRPLGYGLSWAERTDRGRDWQPLQESLRSLVVNAALTLGLCFGVGQLASVMMPRAVTVATVGFVLAGLAFVWQQLMAYAVIPGGLSVLPLVVGLLLASALRMTDWLEERNSVRGWLRVIGAILVPSLVTLIGVPIYRVAEIPAVSSVFSFPDNGINIAKLLNTATGDVPAVAKQTAQRWIRLAESLEDEPIFEWTVVVESHETGGRTEIKSVDSPKESFVIHSASFVWENLKNRDWLARHANLVVEAARVAQEADCAFDPEIFEEVNQQPSFRIKRLSNLAVLLKMAAEAAMAEGKLDEALRHWLVLLRLSEHIQQHAPWHSALVGERLETVAWSFLLRWARHPAQTGDSLRAALGRSMNETPHPLLKALKDHVVLVPRKSNVVLEEYSAGKRDLKQYWQEVRWPVSWMCWERKREERLLDFSAAVALVEMGGYLPLHFPVSWQGDDRLLVDQWGGTRRERAYAGFLQETTRNPSPSGHYSFVWTSYSANWQRPQKLVEAAAWRRGLIVTLALRAFQLDHGRLPSQWDELIGPYLDSVPVDPWSGLPFELRSQGYPFEIEMLGGRIPAHTPLAVSRGPDGRQHLTPAVRPSANDKEPPTTEWVLFGGEPWRQPWPPPEHGSSLRLIAFPLSATEP